MLVGAVPEGMFLLWRKDSLLGGSFGGGCESCLCGGSGGGGEESSAVGALLVSCLS